GALRWVKTDQPAEQIRALAREHGGHATLYQTVRPEARTRHGAFTPLSPALMKIHQRLKRELDAQNIFNPGRMFPGL
ncbi:MAG: glycolate oxidase binding subunit, partial [Pseudomonadota bacterium]